VGVRDGYKQTEVGVIPKEWEVKSLGELGNVVRGGSPRPAGDPRYFDGSYIPWLTVASLTNISDNQIYVHQTSGFLTEEGASYSRRLSRNTLIIANSGATLGVAKILALECCANDGIAAIINQTEGDKEYTQYFINSRTKHLRNVVATGNGQPNLNTTLIRNTNIPFPPLPEQRAIAGALSDVDDLIAQLEQLVAKKQAIKQGAMQALLTGRQRLPGFEGEWEEKQLGEVFSFLGTASKPRSDLSKDGNIDYIHYGDIHTGLRGRLDLSKFSLPRISAEKLGNYNKVTRGDLIIADASEDENGIGWGVEIIELGENPVVAGLHTILLRPKPNTFALGFSSFIQEAENFKRQMKSLATGVSVFGITKKQLETVVVIIPPLPEQQAIATVLTDMDTELASLQQRLTKTRALKQGMMQELLTGRIRLVPGVLP
jgi:type I restriction enzyme, S subunit